MLFHLTRLVFLKRPFPSLYVFWFPDLSGPPPRRWRSLLCCYCVVAIIQVLRFLTVKTSYTYINNLRADLTFSLVTASFCNYKYSVRVAAFFTSRADVQTVCCGPSQLTSVQTTYHPSFLLPLQGCPSKGTSMRIFTPDSFSACRVLNFVCSEAFHYVLLKAKSFPRCLRQHRVCHSLQEPPSALPWLPSPAQTRPGEYTLSGGPRQTPRFVWRGHDVAKRSSSLLCSPLTAPPRSQTETPARVALGSSRGSGLGKGHSAAAAPGLGGQRLPARPEGKFVPPGTSAVQRRHGQTGGFFSRKSSKASTSVAAQRRLPKFVYWSFKY